VAAAQAGQGFSGWRRRFPRAGRAAEGWRSRATASAGH